MFRDTPFKNSFILFFFLHFNAAAAYRVTMCYVITHLYVISKNLVTFFDKDGKRGREI